MSDSRPDVIVILVDDMGYSDLGCYGGEIDTPHIDSLAAAGIRYTQFYNCARCCPTRAALLTGLYPHRAGIGHMTSQGHADLERNQAIARGPYQGYLSNNTATLAEALKADGYQTFMSGKWHVGSFRPNWPTDRKRRDPDNTVIMFLSDNGACAESHDPVPDVPAGPRESDTACFLPWANASNTPFRLFKHWLHEGGSATPFIVHYPKLVREGRIESGYYAHVKDIMGTVLELAGSRYPSHARGYPILASDSRSFVPNMQGFERENPETLFLEHEGNRAVRHGRWKLVSYYNEARGFIDGPVGTGTRTGPWELYDLEADRVELHDLAAAHPQLRDKLIEEYGRFAERTGVSDWDEIQRDLEKLYRE